MWSASPAVTSADGRYVAFASYASNLVAGDTGGHEDVFLRDRTTNVTSRVSVDSFGGDSNGGSSNPSISADGRYVTFYSNATDLVPGDTNGAFDVFVRDRTLNTTSRVSLTSLGTEGNADSTGCSISADGRYVAFFSFASNVVPGDTNGTNDVFVRDRTLNTTSRVSINTLGVGANGNSDDAEISADGRYVAFESAATNLVAGDTNHKEDVFVRDRTAGTTTRVSVGGLATQGNDDSYVGSISADGRLVAFESDATNLVAGDTNAKRDVFVRDRVSGTTSLVSVDSLGAQGNDDSHRPSISANGRSVAFTSRATNLVSGDTNGADDIFAYDAPELPTTITINASATTAHTGNVPILSGAVTPIGMVGRNIVVYVKKPGKAYWTYSSNRTAYLLSGHAAWQYKYYFKPGMTKGTYLYKAVVPAYLAFATSTSPTTVSIRLK
jgi:hypothetical protein